MVKYDERGFEIIRLGSFGSKRMRMRDVDLDALNDARRRGRPVAWVAWQGTKNACIWWDSEVLIPGVGYRYGRPIPELNYGEDVMRILATKAIKHTFWGGGPEGVFHSGYATLPFDAADELLMLFGIQTLRYDTTPTYRALR